MCSCPIDHILKICSSLGRLIRVNEKYKVREVRRRFDCSYFISDLSIIFILGDNLQIDEAITQITKQFSCQTVTRSFLCHVRIFIWHRFTTATFLFSS